MRGGVLLNFLKSNLLGLCDDTMWLPFAHSSRGVRRSASHDELRLEAMLELENMLELNLQLETLMKRQQLLCTHSACTQ